MPGSNNASLNYYPNIQLPSDDAVYGVNYGGESYKVERTPPNTASPLFQESPRRISSHPTYVNRLESRDSGVSDSEGTDIDSEHISGVNGFSSDAGINSGCDSMDSNGCDMDVIKTFAVLLGIYITTDGPECKYGKTLKRMALNVEERHRSVFENMISRLGLETQNTSAVIDCFKRIANELFSDKNTNWGRIVTIYAFAYSISKYMERANGCKGSQEEIGKACGEFVGEQKSEWIKKNGGWEGMEEFFKEQNSIDGSIWKGLIYTFLGLGALATTVSLTR